MSTPSNVDAPDIDLLATIGLAASVIADPRRKFTISANNIMALCHCLVAVAEEAGFLADGDSLIEGGEQERRCRVCGCTQNNACVADDVGPCWWVAPDLCSHCQPTTNARLAAAVARVLQLGEEWEVAEGACASADARPAADAIAGAALIALAQSLDTLKTIFEQEFPDV